jgi:hypothetical protein
MLAALPYGTAGGGLSATERFLFDSAGFLVVPGALSPAEAQSDEDGAVVLPSCYRYSIDSLQLNVHRRKSVLEMFDSYFHSNA